MIPPVSVVIPVFNGGPTIRRCLASLLKQLPSASEVIVVDDGGDDAAIRATRESDPDETVVRVIRGRGHGAAAALNDGIAAARHAIVCQVDQDVILHPGWFERMLREFEDPDVAGVQGRYAASDSRSVVARCSALDLAVRYAAIERDEVDHVCTGNSAYRAAALRSVGGFDETLGYGYDNDASYRLAAAGFRLRFRRDATSTHAWPQTVGGYLRQQFGLGYGRLDVIARHPERVTGDVVSGPGMIAHAAATAIAFMALPFAPTATFVILAALAAERSVAGVIAWRRFGDRAALLFPGLHLLRDAAWTCAIVLWTARRMWRASPRPDHSMPRGVAVRRAVLQSPALQTVAAVIPALNERSALPIVVADLRARWPELRVIVVDDGSDDDTFAAALRLGCDAIRLPLRLGVGSAVRAGIRYARRLGYATIVRVDGDGQHAAEDIPAVVAPILTGEVDAVAGVRTGPAQPGDRPRLIGRRCLGAALSLLVGRRVEDPTSGFWAFGPRATKLLATEHPTGYPEPELHLLLARAALRTREVPVSTRRRIAGTTSLTPWRAGLALGRALLAMVVVPLRPSGSPRA